MKDCKWQVWIPDHSTSNGEYKFSKTVKAQYAKTAAMEFLGSERRTMRTRLLVVPEDPDRTAVVLRVNPTFVTERSTER